MGDEQDYSDEMHRRNNPHYFADDDFGLHDDWYDEDDYPYSGEEPCGSCDWCGTDIYPADPGSEDGLCEQCAWHADLVGPPDPNDEDSGWQPVV